MAAIIALEHLKGIAPGTPAPASFVRWRSDDNDERNHLAPVTLPQDVATTFSQRVTGRTTVQTIDVVSSAYFAPDDCAIVEGGSENQEVVRIDSMTDAGVLAAICRNPHPFGCEIRKVTAAVAKVFQLRIDQKPETNVANMRMYRVGALPKGVYDQFRMLDAYAEADAVPWVSSATERFTAVPQSPGNAQLAIGPWTDTATAVLFSIQWVFTAEADPNEMPEVQYQFLWDEL